jgi:diaminopimelate epimerase
VETGWAPITASVRGEKVSLELPAPPEPPRRLPLVVGGRELEGSLLSVGVPHLVVPVADPVAEDLATLGPPLRHHAALGPEGANLDLVAAVGGEPVPIRTFERGVEGETLACGSGVVAAGLLVMAGRGGRKIRMLVASGDVLEVEARGRPPLCPVRLTGGTRIIAEIAPSAAILEG